MAWNENKNPYGKMDPDLAKPKRYICVNCGKEVKYPISTGCPKCGKAEFRKKTYEQNII